MGKGGGSTRIPKFARKQALRNEEREQETYDYLQGREELPYDIRSGALGQLGGIYGLQQPEGYEGQWGSQQGTIDQARQSPLYAAIMGGQKEGEQSIMRNQSMTGGLRSGNTQSAFMDFNTQLSNQALLQSYNQQLRGLEGLSQAQPMQTNLAARLGPTNVQGAAQNVGGGGGLGTGDWLSMGGSFLSNSGGMMG